MENFRYNDGLLVKRQKLQGLDVALYENQAEWNSAHDVDGLSENLEDGKAKRKLEGDNDYAANQEPCYTNTSMMPSCALSPSSTCGSFSHSRSPAPLTTGNIKNPLICDDTWNVRLEELTAYKQKHGNCLVPKKSRSNPQLGIWVMNQRGRRALTFAMIFLLSS